MATRNESAEDFFSKSGPLPPSFDDDRRYPRFYFRTCAEATIYPIGRKDDPTAGSFFVVTCDLSRAGVSLLHSAQLFPGQRIDLVLNGEPPRQVRVIWCRRWEDGRYLAGCRFVTPEAPAE